MDISRARQLARQVRLTTRKPIESLLGGQYRSAFRGSGLAFDTVREYQPGDDVRSIDWNVTARAGKPFSKIYGEERELQLLLAIDQSLPMQFGTGPAWKVEAAKQLFSLLAIVAVENSDRVGLLSFSDRIDHYLPPASGSRHALQLIARLKQQPPQSPSDLALSLEAIYRMQKRSIILFVASDFRANDFEPAFLRLANKHDLIAVNVSDRWEQEWPDVGLVRLLDPSTGRTRLVDSSDRRFRERFRNQELEHQRRFQRLVQRAGADTIPLRTDDDPADVLFQFFRNRAARLRLS